MRKILRLTILLFLCIFTLSFNYGQDLLYNNGASIWLDGGTLSVSGGDLNNPENGGAGYIVITGGGRLEVSGSVVNEDTIGVLSGVLSIGDAYSVNANNTAFLYNDDSINISGDFGNLAGTYWSDTTGTSVLTFNGVGATTLGSGFNSQYNQIDFEGGGAKNLVGRWNVFDVDFGNGVVHQNSSSDTFYLLPNGSVLNQGPNAYYNGEFWNEGTGLLDFPIGNGPDWRPMRILNNPVNAVMGMRVSGLDPAGFAPVAGADVTNISNRRYWKATDLSGTYAGSPVMFLFDAADTIGTGAATLSELVVVQSDSTKPWNSIGNAGTTNEGGGQHTITSTLFAGEDFITIGGGCSNVKIDVRVLLEGGYTGGPNMTSDINFFGHADGAHSNNGGGSGFTSNKGMYPGYFMPSAANDAIDVIAIILRETTMPYNRVDTALVWLMDDGSIRDFWSGSQGYANFCDAVPGNSYYVEVQHRTHLAVMNNTPIVASTAVPGSFVDFRSDVNVWGGGGLIQYGADFYVITGNANGDWSVNGLDRYQILVDQGNLITGYTNTNVDFNDGVDVADEQRGQNNSLLLKYSTSP